MDWIRFTTCLPTTIRRAAWLLISTVLAVGLAGCSNKVLDPTQIGRFRPTPAVNVILDSLGVAEEPGVAWEAADEPRPNDVRAVKTDYALQPGDEVRISIFELLQEGAVVVNDYVVTETGKLSIPEVGMVQASGLTEAQLEDEIRKTLSPNILRNPSVTVTLVMSQQRAFSILGNGVPAPGRYFIPRYDYRLLDALATAQVQMQFNASHVYVSRRERSEAGRPTETQGPGVGPELETIQPNSAQGRPQPAIPGPESAVTTTPPRDIPEPSESAQRFENEREMLDLIAPQATGEWPRNTKVIGSRSETPRQKQNDDISASVLPGGFRLLVPVKSQGSQKVPPRDIVQSPAEFGTIHAASAQAPRPQSGGEERMEWVFEGDQWRQVPARSAPAVQPSTPPSAPTQPGGEPEWVLRNGNWVQVPRGQAQPTPPAPVQPPAVVEPRRPTPTPDGVMPPTALGWDQTIQSRSIRIPADRLLAGDPRYNIVIRPGDTIHVPVDLIGEFYIMGNVNRTGTINLTGRPLTLMMAVAAAGGLGPLAYPKRVEVRRRIGTKMEEIVLVDLDRIASGEQPDFFIKPNDLVNVGTDITSRWRAILRNAFRATYGFGFVYDRNFADADFGKGFQLPHWL